MLMFEQGKIATNGWGLEVKLWIYFAILFRQPFPDIFFDYSDVSILFMISWAENPGLTSGILNSWTLFGKSKGDALAIYILYCNDKFEAIYILRALTLNTVSC
jgi:hypothetical protein